MSMELLRSMKQLDSSKRINVVGKKSQKTFQKLTNSEDMYLNCNNNRKTLLIFIFSYEFIVMVYIF